MGDYYLIELEYNNVAVHREHPDLFLAFYSKESWNAWTILYNTMELCRIFMNEIQLKTTCTRRKVLCLPKKEKIRKIYIYIYIYCVND